MRGRLPNVCAATILLVAVGGSARAQSPSETALGEALFREGRQLMADGRIEEACAKLEGSQKIDPKIGTLSNVAACHELQGRTATAWAEFSEVVGLAVSQKRATIERFARTHVAALEVKLSRVTIALSQPPEEVDVAIDGKRIVAAAIGTAIPLDPGTHSVEVRAKDGAAWSQSIVVEPGPRSTEIKAPRVAVAPPSAPVALPPAPATTAPSQAPPAPPIADVPPPSTNTGSSGTRRIAAYAALGVGVAAVAVGGYFGVRTFDKKSEGDALCTGAACSQQGYDLQEQARSAATLSTIFVSSGLLAACVGAYLVLSAPTSPAHGGVRVVSMVGAERGGLGVVGEW